MLTDEKGGEESGKIKRENERKVALRKRGEGKGGLGLVG